MIRRAIIIAAACAWATTAQAQQPPTFDPSASATGAQPAIGAVDATPAAVTQAVSPAPIPQPVPSGGTAAAAPIKGQRIPAALLDKEDISKPNADVAARMPSLQSVPRLTDLGDKLKQVVLVGTAEPTSTGVTITWKAVRRLDTAKTIQLPAQLGSKIKTKAKTLPPKQKLTARGDADTLYTAIRQLFDAQQEAAQTLPPSGGQKDAGKPASGSGGGGGGSTPTAAGGTSTNGDVRADTSKSTTSEKDEEISINVRNTIEGCDIRVDLPQLVAIQQEKTITTINGKDEVSPCEDGPTRFPIQKTGLGCTDIVGETEANGQTRLFYVDAAGQSVEVQACQKDPEKVYPIVQDASQCVPFVDQAQRAAFDQAARVYRNDKSVTIVVSDCAPIGNGFPIQATTDGCSLRDDFAGNSTHEQERDFFVKNGTQNFVSSCHDNENVFAHQREACEPQVNLTTGQVVTMSRVFIDTPTGKQYRTVCEPDGAQALQSTNEGCELVHFDYPSASQSRGASRLFWVNEGQRAFVTGCQENSTVLAWQYRPAGFQHDDAVRLSTQMLAATITLGGQSIEVAPPAVRPESARIPYTLDGSQDLPNGQAKSYVGCDAFSPTTRSEVYKRADQTLFTVAVGPGTPAGPVNECTHRQEERVQGRFTCPFGPSDCAPGRRAAAKNTGTTGDPGQCPLASVESGNNFSSVEVADVTILPTGAGGGEIVGPFNYDHVVVKDSYVINHFLALFGVGGGSESCRKPSGLPF